MSDSKGVLDFLQNAPLRLIWGVGLACGVIWYISDSKLLGLIAMFFLVVAGFLSFLAVISLIFEILTEHIKNKKIIRSLNHLSSDEREMVSIFIREDTKNLPLPSLDQTVVSLQQQSIIRRVSTVTLVSGSEMMSGGPRFLFQINPIVWEHLKDNPIMLQRGNNDS